MRARTREIGEDPDALPRLYARIINDSIASRPPEMTVCIHLCRGNFRSSWVAEGGYEPVAEVLFNELDVDGYFLEYDDERSGDFAPLRFVPKGKTVVLGLVSSKVPELESKDELKQRIDEAGRYLSGDQMALSPQCGFSSTVEGNEITEDQQFAKLGLIVETAREVWG
jgi:5-methyltetrahydropteroyltriglutamate--homocysteine methyltransferase